MIQLTTFDDKQYKVCDGTHYNIDTDDAVIEALEKARRFYIRVRLHYGKRNPDRKLIPIDILEEFDSTGRIGRSMGPVKIPILLKNDRSRGGGSILTASIIKITRSSGSKDVLYKHPAYQLPRMESDIELDHKYPHVIYVDGKEHARFRTLHAEQRYTRLFTNERIRMRVKDNAKGIPLLPQH